MEQKPKLPGDAKVHQQTGSDKRFHKPSSTLEPRLVDLIKHVEEHGYVIVHDAFSAHDIGEARETIYRLSLEPHTAGPASRRGRNLFEGHKTQRLYALPNKSRVLRQVRAAWGHPRAERLLPRPGIPAQHDAEHQPPAGRGGSDSAPRRWVRVCAEAAQAVQHGKH